MNSAVRLSGMNLVQTLGYGESFLRLLNLIHLKFEVFCLFLLQVWSGDDFCSDPIGVLLGDDCNYLAGPNKLLEALLPASG